MQRECTAIAEEVVHSVQCACAGIWILRAKSREWRARLLHRVFFAWVSWRTVHHRMTNSQPVTDGFDIHRVPLFAVYSYSTKTPRYHAIWIDHYSIFNSLCFDVIFTHMIHWVAVISIWTLAIMSQLRRCWGENRRMFRDLSTSL